MKQKLDAAGKGLELDSLRQYNSFHKMRGAATHMASTANGKRLARWLETGLDLLFPPHCVACGQAGAWLCQACIRSIPRVRPPICQHCGRPLSPAVQCPCALTKSYLSGMRFVSPHVAPLRQAIHALKYEGVRVLTAPLAELMASTWAWQSIAVDVVVPVPLNRLRQRQRGYNQSALLARRLAEHLALPVGDHLLVRERNTRSQVGLSARERWDNVWAAFRCTPEKVSGRRILLIDDVLTTGATLESCAATLQQAGAKWIWALTLTRAIDAT